MADLKDIFDEEENLRDEELLKYLSGEATDEEKHAVERKMTDSSFDNDAVEGLQHFKKKEKLDDLVQQLNKNLQQQLSNKKQRKEKREIKQMPLSMITVIIILVLCVLAFFVVHLFQRNAM
ncbi:hypothetical protein [Aridibaculum aurantiacum]|uniref:hypothetical protein n=1 Tax=Aridibaculum aurantiacum TaxID=2810307 RepID=UPI001A97C5F4|nr:hypothetical protein [Aridibaculum aurantiacum]